MNPILNQLNQKNDLGALYRLYKTNPREALKSINNPIVNQLLSGGNLQSTFYEMCRQRNIDPNTILKQFK